MGGGVKEGRGEVDVVVRFEFVFLEVCGEEWGGLIGEGYWGEEIWGRLLVEVLWCVILLWIMLDF